MNGSIMKVAGYEALQQNVTETKKYVTEHSVDNFIGLSSTMHIGGETQTTVHQALQALNISKSECITIDTEEEWNAIPQEEKDDPNRVYFLPWKDSSLAYSSLKGLPSIEGNTLIGDMSLDDIGDVPIADEDIVSAVHSAFST